MNKYRIIVTDHALQAMTEIRDYISFELSNPSAARKHLEAFRTEIRKQLTTMPDKFSFDSRILPLSGNFPQGRVCRS